MITAIILVNVERQSLAAVTKEILAVDGIVEVHAVVGEYDLAAIARVKDQQQLSSIIADKMCNQIPGITYTPPPPQEGKLSPLDETREGFLSALREGGATHLKFLQGRYTGIAPLIARELAFLADGDDLRRRQGKDSCVVCQEPMSALNPVMRIGPQVEECLRVQTKLSKA